MWLSNWFSNKYKWVQGLLHVIVLRQPPCLWKILSGTPRAAAAEAPPERRLWSPNFEGFRPSLQSSFLTSSLARLYDIGSFRRLTPLLVFNTRWNNREPWEWFATRKNFSTIPTGQGGVLQRASKTQDPSQNWSFFLFSRKIATWESAQVIPLKETETNKGKQGCQLEVTKATLFKATDHLPHQIRRQWFLTLSWFSELIWTALRVWPSKPLNNSSMSGIWFSSF